MCFSFSWTKISTKRNRFFYVGCTQMPVLYWTLDCNDQPMQGVVESQFTLFYPQNSSPSKLCTCNMNVCRNVHSISPHAHAYNDIYSSISPKHQGAAFHNYIRTVFIFSSAVFKGKTNWWKSEIKERIAIVRKKEKEKHNNDDDDFPTVKPCVRSLRLIVYLQSITV